MEMKNDIRDEKNKTKKKKERKTLLVKLPLQSGGDRVYIDTALTLVGRFHGRRVKTVTAI